MLRIIHDIINSYNCKEDKMAIFKIDTETVKNVSDSIMRLKTEATEIVNSVSNYNTSAINEFHNFIDTFHFFKIINNEIC